MSITTNFVSSNPAQAGYTLDNIMWWSLSVTCSRYDQNSPLDDLHDQNSPLDDLLYEFLNNR
jgi:hypothetical protein